MNIFIPILLLFFCCACQPPEMQTTTQNNTNTTTNNTATPIGNMTNQLPEDMPVIDIGTSPKLTEEELLNCVKEAIIPSYQNWLIFRNGTYIVFDKVDTIPDVKKAAINWLNHYKPKKPEDNNWNLNITDLDKTQGWAVFGNGYGIYTLVHAKELSDQPSPQQIGAYAKAKRALDENNPQIIYISSPKGIEKL